MKTKSKRGFTLVELIVTALITVIIIGAATSAVVLGLEIFGSARKTAAQQRHIKLVETALKENILIAQSYTIEERVPGEIPDVNERGVCLFFDNDEIVIKIQGSVITVSDIDSVEIVFEEVSTLCRARYTITTPGISHQGAIVMNNIQEIDPDAAQCLLEPGSLDVLFMLLPEN